MNKNVCILKDWALEGGGGSVSVCLHTKLLFPEKLCATGFCPAFFIPSVTAVYEQ